MGRRLLRLQVENRFGPLTAAIEQRLDLATESELAQWAVRILSARTVEEIFR